MKIEKKKLALAAVISAMLISTLPGCIGKDPQKQLPSTSVSSSAPEQTNTSSEAEIPPKTTQQPEEIVRPAAIMTRAEYAALMVNKLKLVPEDNTSATFPDMENHWAQRSVRALLQKGILSPSEYAGGFMPEDTLTRAEMIKMAVIALGKEADAQEKDGPTSLADDNEIAPEYAGYMVVAQENGLPIRFPDNTVRPTAEATREEAVALLDKVAELAKNGNLCEEKEQQQKDESDREKEESTNTSNNAKPSKPSSPSSNSSSKPNTPPANTTKPSTPPQTTKPVTPPTSTSKPTPAPTPAPSAAVSFELPKTAHTDTEIELNLKTENAAKLDWTLKKDGRTVNLASYLAGNPTKDKTIRFDEKGAFELTATATNKDGKTVTATEKVTIYPVIELELRLPTRTEINEEVSVELDNRGDHKISWRLKRGLRALDIEDYCDATLDDEGGYLSFNEVGEYTLIVSTTDKTGRVFTGRDTITIKDISELTKPDTNVSVKVEMPSSAQTGKTVTVKTEIKNVQSLTWNIQKDGKTISLSDVCSGYLDRNGGNLSFNLPGTYTLTAMAKDGSGRTASASRTITINKPQELPAPEFSFDLSETSAHTDTTVNVKTESANLSGCEVKWELYSAEGYESEFGRFVEGTLGNDGGSIRFTQPGVYELQAVITNKNGSTLRVKGGKIEVYPVLEFGLNMPASAYEGTPVNIRTTGNTNLLPMEWSLTKDGEPVELSAFAQGELTSAGGKLTFTENGIYSLTASMTDAIGRVFTQSRSISIYTVDEKPEIKPEENEPSRESTSVPETIPEPVNEIEQPETEEINRLESAEPTEDEPKAETQNPADNQIMEQADNETNQA